jgi:phosphatidylglycerol:prolipoprotein diacylglycerol transferase
MKPIPTSFHVGPLQVHTYGIGLAITFYFAYRYFEWRLRKRGYRTDWLVGVFIWIIVAAVVGARLMHVVSNLSLYTHHPLDVFAIWHGGLSSFGGLLLAVPTGIILQRRRYPELRPGKALDIVAPVLMAAWAMGRLLGPQLMVGGGGHRSSQWFCMYYDGQRGCRLPVPIFQAIEDFSVFVVLIVIEHFLNRWSDGTPRTNYPSGIVLGTAMVLWGVDRTIDQHLWLTDSSQVGGVLVQVAGIVLFVGGLAVLWNARRRWQAWLAAGAPGGRDEPLQLGAPGPRATGSSESQQPLAPSPSHPH